MEWSSCPWSAKCRLESYREEARISEEGFDCQRFRKWMSRAGWYFGLLEDSGKNVVNGTDWIEPRGEKVSSEYSA